jgi:N-acetylmuramoyl-L-alanine amidase
MGSKRLVALALFAILPLTVQAVFDTVVLDAGHGGWDQGGLRNVKIPEKKMTLLTAREVRTLLQDAGLKVVMTRESDVYIPLSDRVSIANSQDDAIFVSIHYNADYGSSGNGIETYCARGSSRSVPLRDMIHRQLIRRTGARNRGVRTAGFYVLRHTDTIAVLVEGGFLSNKREAAKIADDEYRNLLAECIADGILDYRDSVGGSKLPRNRKAKEPKPEVKKEKPKPKPAEEPKPKPKPEAAKSEPKKKAPVPKPAEPPAVAKKPAVTETKTETGADKPANAPPSPAPKDTNSVSEAPPPEEPPKQELGPKTATPEEPTAPPSTAPSAPTSNQFRATPIGLRE